MTLGVMSSRIHIRLLRFICVGLLCLGVQYAVVDLLRSHADMRAFYTDVVAFLISAQLNFVLSSQFSWRDAQRVHGSALVHRWTKFLSAVILAALVNAGVYATVLPMVNKWKTDTIIALVCAGMVSMCITFMLNHYYVFRVRARAHGTHRKGATRQRQQVRRLHVVTRPSDGIAFFMPIYNEVENIARVVEGLVAYLQQTCSRFQIILVNDGSKDGTEGLCDKLAEFYPNVRAIHQPNKGYGGALRTGFAAALETHLPWIGFIDSDDQFGLQTSFGRLVAEIIENDKRGDGDSIDVAVGDRVDRADGLKRLITGRGWHYISRILLPHDAHDVDCGCKLFRRESIVHIVPQLVGGYATTSVELMHRLRRDDAVVVNVPVKHYPREFGHQTGVDLNVILGSFRDLLVIVRAMRHETQEVPIPVVHIPAPAQAQQLETAQKELDA